MVGYYRKFIGQFAEITHPLYSLLKKGQEFYISDEESAAIEALKNKLTTAPILNYPDFDRTFMLTSDASQKALGAVLLSQMTGYVKSPCKATWSLRVLFWKKLTDTESR